MGLSRAAIAQFAGSSAADTGRLEPNTKQLRITTTDAVSSLYRTGPKETADQPASPLP